MPADAGVVVQEVTDQVGNHEPSVPGDAHCAEKSPAQPARREFTHQRPSDGVFDADSDTHEQADHENQKRGIDIELHGGGDGEEGAIQGESGLGPTLSAAHPPTGAPTKMPRRAATATSPSQRDDDDCRSPAMRPVIGPRVPITYPSRNIPPTRTVTILIRRRCLLTDSAGRQVPVVVVDDILTLGIPCSRRWV